MGKSMVVLAVPHQLQGPRFSGFIEDPSYSQLLEYKIQRKGIDFVFEEAGERQPTIAERAANSILGRGHYLNLDPSKDDRQKLGIGTAAGSCIIGDQEEAIASGFPPDTLGWTIVEEQRKREDLWLQRIQAQEFEKGLAICGSAHNLSLAFRLLSAGISVVKTHDYLPCHKLCSRRHAK
jgi:hypothetical protein